MKRYVLLLILALSSASCLALALQETHEQTEASDANSPESNFTILNLPQFAEENPVGPDLAVLTKEAAFGKNASINLTQVIPGSHFGSHYHLARDEIDYVIQGQANMTIDGRDYPIKSGDLIYIPPSVVHDFTAIGNETFQIIVVFTPPFDGKDRIYV